MEKGRDKGKKRLIERERYGGRDRKEGKKKKKRERD